ncbi:MAG: ABC transporter permease, partial [Candidatus Cellulosilyticum pullistercoris]|nr:ABC transporter permease [Candidatus Cellulosilyticum pullistercoris]
GGILGAAISFLISLLMNASGEKIAAMMDMYGASSVSIMTPELLGAGILFSVVVGLLSGYFPARKAMKLSALSAIRTE